MSKARRVAREIWSFAVFFLCASTIVYAQGSSKEAYPTTQVFIVYSSAGSPALQAVSKHLEMDVTYLISYAAPTSRARFGSKYHIKNPYLLAYIYIYGEKDPFQYAYGLVGPREIYNHLDKNITINMRIRNVDHIEFVTSPRKSPLAFKVAKLNAYITALARYPSFLNDLHNFLNKTDGIVPIYNKDNILVEYEIDLMKINY